MFQGVSITGNSDSFVSDGRCKEHTAPRASFTCHTRNFSRMHVAQVLEPSSGQDLWIVVVAILKNHSISSMFHRTLLDPQSLRTSLLRFLHLHLVGLPLLRCYIPRRVHPLPLCKEDHSLADWLNNHLSHVLSPSLLSKSAAEHTAMNLL